MSDVEQFAAEVSWFRTGDGNFATDTHIRVMRDEDGEPLFIASDIARALGYRMASDMTRRIDPEDRGTRSVRTPSGDQDMTVLTESGFYTAVLGSQVPHARDFKRWVTADVLPAIRKTGSYAAARALPTKKELAQWVVEAEERAEAAEAKVRELVVPASAWQKLAEAAGDYAVADAAKVLSRDPNITTGERRLFDFMRAERWVYREGGRWRAYQSQVELGRLCEKVGRPYYRGDTLHNGDPTVRITPKGLSELHRRMVGSGQLAPIAQVTA